MYLLYMLFIVASFAVCADRHLVPPSTPPQDIKGRHCRKVSVAFSQASISLTQELKKDSPLKVSQDDNEDPMEVSQNTFDPDDELPFPMDP